MAAVKVTINGVIIDKYGRTISGPIAVVGEMMYSELGVGGGPIFPPEGGDGKPPIDPGLHPEHPIYLPPKPPEFPNPPTGGVKPPPPGGGWGFHPEYGWGYFPGPGEPSPKG